MRSKGKLTPDQKEKEYRAILKAILSNNLEEISSLIKKPQMIKLSEEVQKPEFQALIEEYKGCISNCNI